MKNKGEGRMNSAKSSTGLKFLREESGQALPWISLAMVMMVGMTGFVVDMGRAMVINNRLQAGTQAAALAGANDLPNNTFANDANAYSSSANNDNYSSFMPNVVTDVAGYCSSFVANTLGIACQPTSTGSAKINAMVVTQTVTMPTTFMRLLGIPSITFTSTATAAWKGSARLPYNVAVILDATGSMNAQDTGNDGCNSTAAFACALTGVQSLLTNLTPCAAGGGCTSSSVGLDQVALYVFPGLSNTQAATDDVNCNAQIAAPNVTYTNDGGFGENDSNVYFGFPGTSTGDTVTPQPSAPIYQLVTFSDDYKTSTGALSSSSNLVKAIGGAGESNCKYISSGTYYKEYGAGKVSPWAGIQAAGGADTYYASIIYQAQSDLYTQYTTRLNAGQQTQNIIVLLSDGDANMTDGTNLGGEVMKNGSPQQYCTGSGRNQTCSDITPNQVTSGVFPSWEDPCQQAVTAAQAATNGTFPSSNSGTAKTTVYTVAFGAETKGCNELDPCDTMKEMASSYTTTPNTPDTDFYSDDLATQNGSTDTSCTSGNGITNIQEIFQNIALTLQSSKLIQTGPGCTATNNGTTTGTCN